MVPSCFTLTLGTQVYLPHQPSHTGTVAYIGPVPPKRGTFVGIRCVKGLGKNDGSVSGKRFFVCGESEEGVFAPVGMVRRVERRREPGDGNEDGQGGKGDGNGEGDEQKGEGNEGSGLSSPSHLALSCSPPCSSFPSPSSPPPTEKAGVLAEGLVHGLTTSTTNLCHDQQHDHEHDHHDRRHHDPARYHSPPPVPTPDRQHQRPTRHASTQTPPTTYEWHLLRLLDDAQRQVRDLASLLTQQQQTCKYTSPSPSSPSYPDHQHDYPHRLSRREPQGVGGPPPDLPLPPTPGTGFR